MTISSLTDEIFKQALCRLKNVDLNFGNCLKLSGQYQNTEKTIYTFEVSYHKTLMVHTAVVLAETL